MALGRVSDQGSLLSTGLYRDRLLTRGSFYQRLTEHGHEVVRDEDFAHLYAPRLGRPSIPPSVLVRAMLCATHDKTSDAETSRRTRVDLDWKAAMGVDDDFGGIGATTFSLFRARLVVHDADGALFDKTLAAAVRAGVLAGPLTAVVDSSPVRGAGAVADTYELLRGFLVKTARAAGARLSHELAGPANRLAPASRSWTGRTRRLAGRTWVSWWSWPGRCSPSSTTAPTRRCGSRLTCSVGSWPMTQRPTPRTQPGGGGSAPGWPATGWSRTPTRRCATGASRPPAASTATSCTC